jgi:MFS family permease
MIRIRHNQCYIFFLSLFFSLSYGYFLLFEQTTNCLFTHLIAHFHLSISHMGWLLSSDYLFLIIFQIPTYILMTRYSLDKIVFAATGFCCLGIFIFFVSDHIILALFGRLLHVFGASFLLISLIMLVDIFGRPGKKMTFLGFVITLSFLSVMLSKNSLHKQLMVMHWHEDAFWFLLLGLVLLLGHFLIMHYKKKTTYKKRLKRFTSRSLTTLRRDIFGLFQDPQLCLHAVVNSLIWISISLFSETWFTAFFEQGLNYKMNDATHIHHILLLGVAIGAPIVGILSDHTQHKRLFLTLGSAISAMMTAFIIYVPNITPTLMPLFCFILGIGCSTFILTFQYALQKENKLLSVIFMMSVTYLSGLFKMPIASFLDQNMLISTNLTDHALSLQAFQIAFLMIPLSMILTTLLSFQLQDEPYFKDGSV